MDRVSVTRLLVIEEEEEEEDDHSCVPNDIIPLVYYNAVHLLCGALMSAWLVPFCSYWQ